MIQVLMEKDESVKAKLFAQSNIKNIGECITARDGEEILGYCLFLLNSDSIKILDISPKDDILMADGVLRSALHVASERFIFKAYYDNDQLEELLNKLAFIKDKGAKEIDIDKLFRGCKH